MKGHGWWMGLACVLAGLPVLMLGPSAQAADPVTVADLLARPSSFHAKTVVVRGTVTRPELHLSEDTLFIDFVFVLRDGDGTITVFGRHDRTQGDIQVATGRLVEVEGVFYQEHITTGARRKNALHATRIVGDPGLIPHRT